jgi:DNA-nicking Smr family endonuclease
MDPPKLQQPEQEKELIQQLLRNLKILYKDKNVYRRPRGSPRKVQVQPRVNPSQIRRFRLTPQQLMELVNPEQSKKKRSHGRI